MIAYPEYFVVAFGHADPNIRQTILRFAPNPGEQREAHFEQAVRDQKRLKFEFGFPNVFLYEAQRVEYRNGEFIPTLSACGTPPPVCEACGTEIKKRGKYSAEEIAGFIRRHNVGKLICKECAGR